MIDFTSGEVIESGEVDTNFSALRSVLAAVVTGTNTLSADTISEVSSANGVAIDSVTLKDGGVTVTAAVLPSVNDGTALGSASKSFSDLFLADGGVINWNAGNYTITHSSGALTFSGAPTFSAGGVFATAPLPSSDDACAIGASGTAFSDLFLASGGVIDFNAGDVVLTHSSNVLTLSGGSLVVNGGFNATGSVIKLDGLPTSDPSSAGVLWNDSGVVTVSSG